MGFTQPGVVIEDVGSGVVSRINNTIYSTDTFQDGIIMGRFAKLDSGSIDKLDASATPVIAGVILRNVNNPIEDGDTIKADTFDQLDYLRVGHVTVDVVAGQTPVRFGAVYAVNLDSAETGKARTDNTDAVDANAEFIREIKPNVWKIRLK